MKKVVSIALFGNATAADGSGMAYHQYLSTFVLAHLNLFPTTEGWELRLFVDHLDSAVGVVAAQLAINGAMQVDAMGPAIRTKAMLWRMQPCFEDGVDYVFCRDIDCIPMPRDRACMDQFIQSKLDVHTIHDSASHVGIMGGLCGFHGPAFRLKTGLRSLDDLYKFAKKTDAEWAVHGTDQNVLNRLIDRADGPTLLEHRYNGWHIGPDKYVPREAGSYKCKAYSCPTPNGSLSSPDFLANHLGAAGYDRVAARQFWEAHGDPEITKLVRACEI